MSDKMPQESIRSVYGIWVVFGQGMGGQMAQEKEGGKKARNSDSNSSAEVLPSIRKHSVGKQLLWRCFRTWSSLRKGLCLSDKNRLCCTGFLCPG